jgi:hypothetical protein
MTRISIRRKSCKLTEGNFPACYKLQDLSLIGAYNLHRTDSAVLVINFAETMHRDLVYNIFFGTLVKP